MHRCLSDEERYRSSLHDVPTAPYRARMSKEQTAQYDRRVRSIRDPAVRNYIAYRIDLKRTYHRYLLLLKAVLVLGLVIMAIRCRYVNFIRQYPKQFVMELAVFALTAVLCYVFFVVYRGARVSVADGIRSALFLSGFTIVVIVCAELGSMETLFGREGEDDPYTRERLAAQQHLPRAIIDTSNVILVVLVVSLALSLRREEYWYVLPILVVVSILSYSLPYLVDLRAMTTMDLGHVGNVELGSMILCAFLYIGLFLHVMYMSVFQIHSVNLFSYLADRSRVWKTLDRAGSDRLRLALFFLEAIIIAGMTAIPIFLVAYFRGITKYREAQKEFALLFIKIFSFYVMAQLIGLFDWANRGYCLDRQYHNITDPTFHVK